MNASRRDYRGTQWALFIFFVLLSINLHAAMAKVGDRCKLGTGVSQRYLCGGGLTTPCLKAISRSYCSNVGNSCGWSGTGGNKFNDKRTYNGNQYVCTATAGFKQIVTPPLAGIGERCKVGTDVSPEYLCQGAPVTPCLKAISRSYCSNPGNSCGWSGTGGNVFNDKRTYNGTEYVCTATTGFKPASGGSVLAPLTPVQNMLPEPELLGQLTACLNNKGLNVPALANKAASDPESFIRDSFTSLWQRSMAAIPTMMSNSGSYGTANDKPLNSVQLINQAELLMGQIANQDPIGQCIWSVSGSLRTQAKLAAANLYPTIKTQYDSTLNGVILPAVNRAIVDLMGPLIRQGVQAGVQSLTPSRVRAIALGVGQQRLMERSKMTALNREILGLAEAVRNQPSQVARRLSRVESLLNDLSTFSDKMALDIAMETMRLYGHVRLDNEGRDLLDEVFIAPEVVADGVVAVGTAITGFFYVEVDIPGEAIGFFIEYLLAANEPATKWAIMKATHAAWDQLMMAAKPVIQGVRGRNAIKIAGPLGLLLKEFPTEEQLIGNMSPQLAQMKSDLFGYHQAVLDLSRAAAATQSSRPAQPPAIQRRVR